MSGVLRIAFPTSEYVTEAPYGGLATYLHKTSKYLKNLGHEPVIFLLSDINKVTTHEDVTVIYVKHKTPFWFWIINITTFFIFNTSLLTITKSLSLKSAIEDYNKNHKVSIIQYSNAQFLSVLSPKSIKHCLRLSHFYFEYSKYIYEKPRSFKNIQKNYLEKICLLKARNAIYGPSKLIATLVEKELGIKVPVIRTPLYRTTKNHTKSVSVLRPKYLLYFGTLTKSKGVDLIANIIHELLDNHNDIQFKLVGRNTNVKLKDNSIFSRVLKTLSIDRSSPNSKETYADYIKRLSGIHSDRVHYSAPVQAAQMQDIIKEAFAIVLPSKIDNFPNTLSESLSNGKIVIVAENSSLDELIKNRHNGFVFKNNSSQSLLETIHRVLQLSEKDRLTVSNEAFKTSETIHPRRVIEVDLINFYNKILR